MGPSCYATCISAVSDAEIAILDSYLKATGKFYGRAVYLSGNGAALISNCELVGVGQDGAWEDKLAGASGIDANGGKGRVMQSRLSAEALPAQLGNSALVSAIKASGAGSLYVENCDIIARAGGGTALNNPDAAGIALVGAGSAYMIQARGCRILAYTDETNYGTGYGVYVESMNSGLVIQLMGCTFPTVALSGAVQTGALKIPNTAFADAKYHVTGNIFSGANSSPYIIVPAENDPADNYYMAGNMFGVNVG